jgi:hypothetical protein
MFSGSEEQYFPYAAACKEFDKLSKRTRGGGPAALILKVIELLALGIGAFSVHLMKGPKLIVFIVWIALTIFAIFQWINGRWRFLHWARPRCQSEWSGTKDEKDRACRVCGLRLHQMSPRSDFFRPRNNGKTAWGEGGLAPKA